MTPQSFKKVNIIFTPPEEWDRLFSDLHGPCADLPVYRTSDGVHISCWRLSLLERLKLLFIPKIYLHIVGTQPAVKLTLDIYE